MSKASEAQTDQPTKAEMLEAMDDALSMWDGIPPAFYSPDEVGIWYSIRALIESTPAEPDPFAEQRREQREYCEKHAALPAEVKEALDEIEGGLIQHTPDLGPFKPALATIRAALTEARQPKRVSRDQKNSLIKGMAGVIVVGVLDGNTEPWVENKLDVFTEELGIVAKEPK